MKIRSWFVAVFVFFTITLFAPGCITWQYTNPDAGDSSVDGALVPSNDVQLAVSDAGALPSELDVPMLSIERDSGSPSTTPRDTGSPVTPREDAGATTDRPPPLPTSEGVQGIILAPTTCQGRRLGASSLAPLGIVPAGYTLWHLCFKTPIRTSSTSPLANERPARVSVHVVNAGRAMNEAVSGNAPATANPWTFSVLISLPPGQTPNFHARAHYANGQTLSFAVRHPPSINGEIKIWQVASDGEQTERVPNLVCEDPLDNTNANGIFLPTGICPSAGRMCPGLTGYICEAL